VLVVFVLFAAVALTSAVTALGAIAGVISAPQPVLILGIVTTILLGAATSGLFRFIRRSSVSIDELAAAAERVERGDYGARVDERGPRPVRSLARAFNQMSARLGAIDEGRRSFLADAAHELRTPLAIIKGQIEAIEDGVYPADAEHLAPIHDQIQALEKLIEDMRTVALAEGGGLTLDVRPTDLSEVIDDACAAFAPAAEAASVRLSAEIPGTLPRAMVDEARVRQILANLLTNGLRHTPRGGEITVSARARDAQWIEVCVRDTGTGIAPELLPTVFERFTRDDASPGSGLGLAICRDLVEAHGGRIEASSSGGGTTVTFTLPAVESGG
jgi:two-component system sensor histidine kinase BaeS